MTRRAGGAGKIRADLWYWPDPANRSRSKTGSVDDMLADYGFPAVPPPLAPTLANDEPGNAPTLADSQPESEV